MKLILAIILSTYTFSTPGKSALDIIQIDTGNIKAYSGILNMPKSKKLYHPTHGSDMARALENELKKLHAQPIHAMQVLWNPKGGAGSVSYALMQVLKKTPKIASMSLSGKTADELEKKYLKVISNKNILILVAAGNYSKKKLAYPASYKIPCLVSVGTKAIRGGIVDGSNLGDIYLVREPGEYGNSYSTARAAAHAINLWKNYPKASCVKIKQILIILLGK